MDHLISQANNPCLSEEKRDYCGLKINIQEYAKALKEFKK